MPKTKKSKPKTHEVIYWCTKEAYLVHELVELGDGIKCSACEKQLKVDYPGMEFIKNKDHVLKAISELGKE